MKFLSAHWQRASWALAILATLVAASTEPLIPALFKPLLDEGFSENALPLWMVPTAVIGIFAVRGAAFFISQYALARIANDGMQALRQTGSGAGRADLVIDHIQHIALAHQAQLVGLDSLANFVVGNVGIKRTISPLTLSLSKGYRCAANGGGVSLT